MVKDVAYNKLIRYCAYQERCHSEVRTKLLSLGIYGDELEEIIGSLVKEGYLNEMRFAELYARSKHRLKKWGRLKIRQELWRKNVSAYCINKALILINESDYLHTIESLARRYMESRTLDHHDVQTAYKTKRYLIAKGYESELVNRVVSAL